MSERDVSPMAETFELSCSPAPQPQPQSLQLAPSPKPLIPAPKVALSPKEEAQARERLAILEPLINFQLEKAAAPREQLHLDLGLLLPDGRRVLRPTAMAEYLAQQHQLSPATIWRWYTAYRKKGLLGLAKRVHKDKGTSHFFRQHRAAAKLVAYVKVVQRQTIATAYEALRRDCLVVGVKPCDLPSYGTVYRFLSGQEFSEPLKLLAEQGRAVYRERCAPYLSRTRINVSAGQIWVGDHMIHDLFAMNDSFADAEWGARIRLRFTAFADFRSNMFLGYSWAFEGSSHSITSALRRGIERYGLPESIYCDNGKDYLKVAKGAMPAYLRESGMAPADWWQAEYDEIADRFGIEDGVLARLGIAVQHCIVRHPQSKHVERLFRTVHSGFDRMFPTYSGSSPATRPDFATEAMAEHGKLLRMGRPGNSKLPWTSEVIRMAIAWIEDDYHNKPQKSRDMEGMSPREAFAAFHNSVQRPAPPPEVLALCLAEHESRVVHECAIALANRRYIPVDEIDAIAMHSQNGRTVTVAYDPLDLEKVAILDDNQRLIAWAKPEHYVTQSAESGPAIAASMQLRRRLEKQTVGELRAIADEARANGALTEAEHLAARAGVIAVNDAVTQRRVRLRPDNAARAPMTAAESARRFEED